MKPGPMKPQRLRFAAMIAALIISVAVMVGCASPGPVEGDSLLLAGNPERNPNTEQSESKPVSTSESDPSSSVGKVDLSCKTDADCTVKNVGNCCGYYPQCVNVDSETFPDQIKAQCAREGRSSICGFPSIQSCTCIQGQCAARTGPANGSEVL